MKQKNNKNIFILIAVIIVIVTVSILIKKSITNITEYGIIPEKTYEEKFPLLGTIDFGQDIKGVSNPIKNDWVSYVNRPLGFSIEYPGRSFAYGKLESHEYFDTHPINGKFYWVNFSDGDSGNIVVTIQPSRFMDIWEWKKHNPEYGAINTIFTRRQIGDIDAMVVYSVPEFPYTPDEHIQRKVHIIKDNVFYTILTQGLPNEEYERIWDSFQFID